jgi:IS5 family transposase
MGSSKNLWITFDYTKTMKFATRNKLFEERVMQVGGLFALDDCLRRLDQAGDPLDKLVKALNWEGLEAIIAPLKNEESNKGGRPAWSQLIIVKCMILQAYYNLSDESCEYQVNDRLSFKRFLGLNVADKAPDAKTLWHYREKIKYKQIDKAIFDWFETELNKAGYTAEKGQIVDASFVPTHKPSGKHTKQLQAEIPLTPAQMRQIDTDATFTKKGKATYHGYKDHCNVDVKHKFIRAQSISTASLHDSQEFEALLQPAPQISAIDAGDAAAPVAHEDARVFADSAYRSAKAEAMLIEQKFLSEVHERAYRGKPLTDEQKAENKRKSKIRARVEHVFGHVETAMGGFMIHTIGLARAKVKITFKNIAYNFQRFVFLQAKAMG